MPRENAEIEEALCSIRLFEGLKSADIARIARLGRRQELERGECLFRQEDPASGLYVILRGQAKLLRVTPDGHQVILGFAGPGDIAGAVAALGQPYPVSAEVSRPCSVLVWSANIIADLMEQYPRLALNALHLVTERLRLLQDRYVELSTERVERRVARTLLRLAHSSGRAVEGGILIDLRLSRQDLAEMTGTTLYTISRILSRWDQKQLVESGRERVLIRYPHGLVVIAEDLDREAT